MLSRRLLLVSFVLLAGCIPDRSQPLPLMAATPMPTLTDWNAALKGVVFVTGGSPCLEVRRANVEACSKAKRFNLYCVEEDIGSFSDTTPKGCGVFYMKTLATCDPKIELAAGSKLKCRIDTDVPQPTPSPVPTAQPTPADPLKPCVDKNPSYCWHADSRLSGNDCWADCQCVKRSVGPCAGVKTPKPTVKPTATPKPSVTPAPTASSSLDACIHGSYNYCWHKDALLDGNNCFSNCICLKRPDPNCKTSPYPSAVPTPSPSPTAGATKTPTPPITCPTGMHPVWWCEADATPAPTASVKPTARPTFTAKPAITATPPIVSASFIQGGWFIPECTAIDLFGARSKWYNFPYVFAAYPKGFNKHATDYKEACTPNAEVWTATAPVPDPWTRPVEQNIEIVKPQMTSVLTAIRARKQIIADLKAQGVTGDKLPKMPILWIEEGSSFAYGVSQDLYAGGFYQTVNGKRTVKPAKDLSPPLQGHVAYMISEYQKEGITEFAVAPYSFGWGNTMVNPKLAAPLRGRNTDLRDRWLVVTPPDDGKLRAYSPEQIAQILTQTHPEIWPKGRVWQANPDQVATDANHMVVDTPDDVTLKRDSAYYTFYLYALKAQFPAVTRVIGQLSNCVYNRRDDSPHWAIARSMMTSNQTFGYPADIQIEGCTSKASTDAGKPWNTPVADCRAAKAIKAFTGPSIVSMWHSDIKSGLQLDYRSCP